ncbi:ATP-binding protein [Curtobacterium flaccumfaciens pv. flaccumfaciens]|uniref:ATP-binding protein n=1 Tax=Curtobacterium TaxID=2034 RepID=UPI000DA9C966|nr:MULTISPECIES: ATP-binding protein [Curtobacterium]MBO9046101.1 ATP-binding protein [Curtobacterium flaccumfaciens pv. flaccumfaciens]PZF44651.1 hypothetical protein DEJ07_00840 [Curtobacterium sp. MCLR17_053]PZF52732.1 hypothetical protein DEJ06_06150 [Curtobacterium sp. MCLR17_051]QTR90744.1 ATP-binding protein [Curtobacterium flaccumfaciens pv. flaccumfaciens]QVG66064.1 ATP-binding protein [Curtobacterium flaccumfaciens pv. flaccumfaciens]
MSTSKASSLNPDAPPGQPCVPDEPWLSLLAPEDRDFVSGVFSDRIEDPGFRSRAQLELMDPFDREDYDDARLAYLRMTPLIETTVVSDVLGALETSAKTAARVHRRSDLVQAKLHSQDILILDGDPGVGKTMICSVHLATEMINSARRRWRAMQRGEADHLDAFRPVASVTLDGPTTGKQLLTLICQSLGRPVDKDPTRSFITTIERCGLQLLFVDEIHAVNFDRKTGDHVHHMIRTIANRGVRVILASNDIDWVLQNQRTPGQGTGARISRGRWVPLTVSKLEIDTAAGQTEWADLLDVFESRLRLTDQPRRPGWLADDFGPYLWASTQGYMNALVRLLNDGTARAMETGAERLDRKLFDSIPLQAEVQTPRGRHVALHDSANATP